MIDYESNTGLVVSVYNKRFAKYRWLKEDLIQEGNLALYLACQKYDVNKDTKFSTFATICIKNAMMMYLKREIKEITNSVCDDVMDYVCDESVLYNGDYEEIELKEKLSDLEEKSILSLMVAGFNNREISERVQKPYRVVNKKVKDIKEFLC